MQQQAFLVELSISGNEEASMRQAAVSCVYDKERKRNWRYIK